MDLYSDYLISSFGQTTATGLSELVGGQISHDKITRTLAGPKRTGRELWHGELPQSGKATPMSYRVASGEQFVAIAVGGGGAWGAGDYVVAFKLPK